MVRRRATNSYTLSMGLTIHYQGQLRAEVGVEPFVATVQAFAKTHGWAAHVIEKQKRELTRTLQPEDPDAAEVEEIYIGLTHGIYVLPHEACEPLSFEFDRDCFMQDWCKTQFAGAGVHASIIRLFRTVEAMFEMLDVQDEAEFWEVPDRAEGISVLEETFARTRAEIEEAAEESPGCSVGVLTPSGRILDILAA